MLPKKHRLKKKKNFERVLKEGKGINDKYFFVKFKENDLGFVRVGFIVSKKVSNKAVVRNKVKRRMREGVRGFLSEIQKNLDIVIIAKKGGQSLDFWEIKERLEKILNKLIKNDNL
ncbi:MAG: ribonuclease P protein component [Candidatus Pacebacteria bacterium]|nr:ribonuclease P protein component [Candidatus Paceibacterota bacterium]